MYRTYWYRTWYQSECCCVSCGESKIHTLPGIEKKIESPMYFLCLTIIQPASSSLSYDRASLASLQIKYLWSDELLWSRRALFAVVH